MVAAWLVSNCYAMTTTFTCSLLLSALTMSTFSSASCARLYSNNIAFGFCSSQATVANRVSDLALWWDARLNGVILVDNEHAANLPKLPTGLRVQKTSAPWKFVSDAERCAWGQVSDTYKAFPEAEWYVLGDDDTYFVPPALEALLSRYDASQRWYIGPTSESPQQNVRAGKYILSTGAQLGNYAFGGGGIAISVALMKVVIEDYEQCLHNHSVMYGGDQRIGACIKVLSPGTELTVLNGMHQGDMFDDVDPYAILEAHPLVPLLSLHHMQAVVFPVIGDLRGLRAQIQENPYGALQQSVCQSSQHGTFSIAAGLSIRWWAADIQVNITDLTDPAKRELLPEVSKYYMCSDTLNSKRSAKHELISTWYALLDVTEGAVDAAIPGAAKILVQEPAGPERWLSVNIERLKCSAVTVHSMDNSTHIVLVV